MGNNNTSQSMNIKYWPVTDEGFMYPESDLLKDKKDVGIALSGGGVRAAVLAIGWLQVFHELGYLHKVKYVSSISGGSWTSAPMSNYEGDLNIFLGKTIPPEECSIQRLNEFANQDGSHAKLMTDARFNAYMISDYLTKLIFSPLSLISHNENEEDFWAKSVGSCFFKPHGINTTNMGGLIYRKNFPYPIVNGSIVVEGRRKAIPVEFTPLYHGTPAPFNDKFIDAVYVEPVGFKAVVQKELLSNLPPLNNSVEGLFVNIQVNTLISALNCHEISGISSSALAQEFSGISLRNKYLPHFVYDFFDFPEQQFFSNGVQRFVDGANTDNTGVLALIRRNCTKIAACLANGNPIDKDDITSEAANTMGSLAGLFGAQRNDDISVDANNAINEQRQVFETEKWNELVEALRNKLADGKPLIHRMKLKVLPNALIGVRGNYEADILFAFCGECQEFENKLPSDIKTQLSLDKASEHGVLVDAGLIDGNLKHFPCIPISEQEYPPLLVGLLSQLATYTLLSEKDVLEEWFA